MDMPIHWRLGQDRVLKRGAAAPNRSLRTTMNTRHRAIPCGLPGFGLALLLLVLQPAALAAEPTGVPAGPVKIPATDVLTGKAFKSPQVTAGAENGVPFLDRPMGKSKDGTLEAGIYQSAATHESYEAYPSDEYMFFITGHLTLTGADGHVLEVGPQEGVFIPRGWKGRWDSTAYRKYYVVYTPAEH